MNHRYCLLPTVQVTTRSYEEWIFINAFQPEPVIKLSAILADVNTAGIPDPG